MIFLDDFRQLLGKQISKCLLLQMRAAIPTPVYKQARAEPAYFFGALWMDMPFGGVSESIFDSTPKVISIF